MPPRDLEKERQAELAAVWGTEIVGANGDRRAPRRRRANKKGNKSGMDEDLSQEKLEKMLAEDVDTADVVSESDDDRANSEVDSLIDSEEERKRRMEARKKKEKKSIKQLAEYRLHCFVEHGTTKNDVREVFEDYQPKVEIRTSQAGNALNKVLYCILTFRNKALALHAVKTLDGTNQRDLLGVRCLKLSLMLSREQSKIARRSRNRAVLADVESKRALEEAKEREFIEKFMKMYGN